MQELFYVQMFFSIGCSPDLHHWPGVDENVVNRDWDPDKRRSDQKIVRGKRDRGNQTEGSQLRLICWFSAVGKWSDTSQTKLSYYYPLPTATKLTHIIPRIHPFPPSELWGGDICGERLAGKQCVLQFAVRSLQKQTRLRSLPRDAVRSWTHTHIATFIIHQMPINNGMRGRKVHIHELVFFFGCAENLMC